ncbi:hypothetical protein GEMRC1_013090 [Eukaryota sp. GEM-RC1]
MAQGCEYLAQQLSAAPSVVALIMDHNPFGNHGFHSLAVALKNTRLQKLSVSSCSITFDDEFWGLIDSMIDKSLVSFTVSHNNQHSPGNPPSINPFRHFDQSRLTSLDFSHCKLYSGFFAHLSTGLSSHKPLLRELNVRHCMVTAKDAVDLFQCLPFNRNLISLNISDNLIGSEVATDLLELLKTNSSIHVLDINDNRVYHDVHSGVVSVCSANKTKHESQLLAKLKEEVSLRSFDELLLKHRQQELKRLKNQVNETQMEVYQLEEQLAMIKKEEMAEVQGMEKLLMAENDRLSANFEKVKVVEADIETENKGFSYQLESVNERYQREVRLREAVQHELEAVKKEYEDKKARDAQELEDIEKEKLRIKAALLELRGEGKLTLDVEVKDVVDEVRSATKETITPRVKEMMY